jgi:hypothetical protein
MTRQDAVWWFLILGLLGWGVGLWGVSTFELASFSWHVADLVRTTGLVVFLAVVAIGVWRSLEKP